MRTSLVKFFIGGLFIAILYQNCTAVHNESSNLSSFQACNLILKDEFTNGYQEFLNTNCAECHVSNGTGNGAFADPNGDLAFDAFLVRGAELVADRALDPNHQSPWTGPQHDAEINNLMPPWNSAKEQADLCVVNAGIDVNNDIAEGILPDDPKPTAGTITTFIKALRNVSSDQTSPTTFTWDLSNEIKDGVVSFAGAEFKLDVTALTSSTGDKNYVFSNPRLTTGDQALHLIFIEFVINHNVVEDATSYHSVNRRVAANQTDTPLGVGGTTFPYNIRATDVLAVSFGILEAINFDPPTFTELINPTTGVFGRYCISCHSTGGGQTAAGGFDMTTRQNIVNALKVSPYSPNNSRIFIRMNDAQFPMPQDIGILPQSDIEQVLWWIQDGAQDN